MICDVCTKYETCDDDEEINYCLFSLKHSVVDEPVSEAVCILANIDKWWVKIEMKYYAGKTYSWLLAHW